MRNIIFFVNSFPSLTAKNIKEYEKKTGKSFRLGVIKDIRFKEKPIKEILVSCDTKKTGSITKALLPYQKEVAALVCRGDRNISYFKRIIPHLPYVKTPTITSLEWATDKILMRKRLKEYDPKITPQFMVVTSTKRKTIAEIKKKIGFPLVIKPASLAASILVSICYHEEELEENLKKTFKKIKKAYKESKRQEEPKILVEQFMEGEMYSIDAYINDKGTIRFCPLVFVKTGRSIGFDDFFGYSRSVPVDLPKAEIKEAEEVSKKAIYALGLRSVTSHIELMKTKRGWKIIELAARLGGRREKLYNLVYGINHGLNDVLIRIGEKPIIPKKKKGYAIAIDFFAREEGILKKMEGINRVRSLKSFESIKVNKKPGDRCVFAKNGGSNVLTLILFNKSREDLLADIRRAEQFIKIRVKKRNGK